MPALILPPTQLAGPTALTIIGAQVPAGKVRRYDLRACNVTAAPTGADAYADVYVNDTATPANSGYRAKNYPVPYLQAGSAPDLEEGLVLTAGMELHVRASALAALAFSLEGVELAAPAGILTPIQLTGTTALATIGGETPLNKVRRLRLRACNIGAADGFADIYINDTVTPANSGYRERSFPIPYLQAGSAPDLERALLLTEGQQLQIRASADNTIAFSLTGEEDDE